LGTEGEKIKKRFQKKDGNWGNQRFETNHCERVWQRMGKGALYRKKKEVRVGVEQTEKNEQKFVEG
jgi:hypothetical protein